MYKFVYQKGKILKSMHTTLFEFWGGTPWEENGSKVAKAYFWEHFRQENDICNLIG